MVIINDRVTIDGWCLCMTNADNSQDEPVSIGNCVVCRLTFSNEPDSVTTQSYITERASVQHLMMK